MPTVALDLLELDLQALAQLQVEGAERLVEQQHLGQVDQRARQRDALLLAARELGGPAVRLASEPDALELGRDALVDLGLVDLLPLEPEGHVVGHGHVREQRVALEDGVGGALEGRQPDLVGALDQHLPARRLLEAGDHAQSRRLAAAARPEHREELAAGDLQVDVVDRREVAEALRDRAQGDALLAGGGLARHAYLDPPAIAGAGSSSRMLGSATSRLRLKKGSRL